PDHQKHPHHEQDHVVDTSGSSSPLKSNRKGRIAPTLCHANARMMAMPDGQHGAVKAGFGNLNPDEMDGLPRLKRPPADLVVNKWLRWLTKIDAEIATIYRHREVWQTLNQIVRDGKLPPSYFFEFLAQSYVASQAVAVRRQADMDRRSLSFARLLTA